MIVWSFLIWVKQLIVAAVLGWAGVNLIPPDSRSWAPVAEQLEAAPRACEARRTVIVHTRAGVSHVVKTRVSECGFAGASEASIDPR